MRITRRLHTNTDHSNQVVYREGEIAPTNLIWGLEGISKTLTWKLGDVWEGSVSAPSFCTDCQGGGHPPKQCPVLALVESHFKAPKEKEVEAEEEEEAGPSKRRRLE